MSTRDHSGTLDTASSRPLASGIDWDRVEKVLDRFEDAWRRGERPLPESHLELEGKERQALLIELIHEDLEYRLESDEAVRVEDYLTRFPELRDQSSLVLDLVATEFKVRRKRDGQCEIADYLQRFPELGETLASRLQSLSVPKAPRSSAPGNRSETATSEAARAGAAEPTLDSGADPEPIDFLANAPSVPGYEMLEELGRGGMGVVYKARHLKLNRIVALKMIIAGQHVGSETVLRFLSEAEAAARLRHPNIVQVYDLGRHGDYPYFTMEFVEGGNLVKKLAANPQPGPQAAAQTETLARAVHFAHQSGIIHRDLKPANIMLTLDGVVKITDFGLAKRMQGSSEITQSGDIIGTPSYMAPEQAEGKPDKICPASDVYALGAILYESLTGRAPFKAATPLDTILQVIHDEPVSPRQLQPQTPLDLDTICLKCLRKDPKKRYETAEEMAADLRRFLRGEPISAKRVSSAERLRLWARRRPALAGLLSISAVALMITFGLLVALWHNAETRAVAMSKLNEVEGILARKHAEVAVLESDAHQAIQKTEHALLAVKAAARDKEVALDQYHRSIYAATLMQVQVTALKQPDTSIRLALLEDENRCPRRLRDFTWGYLHNLCRQELASLHVEGNAGSIAFMPDGKALASTNSNGKLALRDSETGKELWSQAADATTLAITADGSVLVTGGKDGVVRLWNPKTGAQVTSWKAHQTSIRCIAVAPDGKSLAAGAEDHTISLWAMTGKKENTLHRHKQPVTSLAFSPDGKWLASTSLDCEVCRWNRKSFQVESAYLHMSLAQGVAFSKDSQFIASAAQDGRVALIDPQGKAVWDTFYTRIPDFMSVAISPDGKLLAAGTSYGTVLLWDLAERKEIRRFSGHDYRVASLAFTSDSKTLASAGGSSIKIWALESGNPKALIGGFAEGWAVAFSPKSKSQLLAAGGRDLNIFGKAVIWDLSKNKIRSSLFAHAGAVTSMAFDPQGQTLITSGYEYTIKGWDISTNESLFQLKGHKSTVSCLAISTDGKTLVSGSGDPLNTTFPGEAIVWDLKDHQPKFTLPSPAGVFAVALAPSGSSLAIGNQDEIQLLDMQTKRIVKNWPKLGRHVTALAFSPDGKSFAAGTGDLDQRRMPGLVKLWDTTSYQERATHTNEVGLTYSLAFSPDSKTLAAGYWNGAVKLFDSATGFELATLQGHQRWVKEVAFSPDGRTLASVSGDGTIQLWQADRFQTDKEPVAK